MKFKIGDTVAVQPFGSKEGFVGTVVKALTSGKNDTYYHIRDAFNLRWHRVESELEAVS